MAGGAIARIATAMVIIMGIMMEAASPRLEGAVTTRVLAVLRWVDCIQAAEAGEMSVQMGGVMAGVRMGIMGDIITIIITGVVIIVIPGAEVGTRGIEQGMENGKGCSGVIWRKERNETRLKTMRVQSVRVISLLPWNA